MHVALSAIRSLQDSNVKGQAAIRDCTNAKKTLIIGHFAKWPMVNDFYQDLRSQNANNYLYFAEKTNHKTPKQSVLGCVK